MFTSLKNQLDCLTVLIENILPLDNELILKLKKILNWENINKINSLSTISY
ncbi:MAG: hypothetical protein ACYDIA_07260 [Candidatus Humimicrobiaceae bacterium]